MPDKPVIIGGGGIGGLAAALGLARKGVHSIVLEQASKFGEIGAGIQLGPNAFHCFDYLGVGDEARGLAVYIDKLRFMDATTGSEIAHIPVGEDFRKRFGNPYAVMHRADLHSVLLEGCRADRSIDLRTACSVDRYEQDDTGVRASLSNGETVDGAALIGADGLHSKVRAQLVGDGAPRVCGHTTFRSVIPTEQMPEDLRWNAATLWAGPKCHLVHYPLKGWKVFNLVATYHSNATEAVTGKPVSKEEVRGHFGHIVPRARQIIDHGDNWKMWVLSDREPIMGWADGRVALLGDAAHPMLQYFAQGACMAMEDAVCISHMVEKFNGAFEPAFAAYCEHRLVRTTRVQLGSRMLGEHIYHPEGPAALVRNQAMRAKSPAQWYDELSWLYGGTGLTSG